VIVSDEEYNWLRTLYIELNKIRARGVQQFNKIPPPARLAVTSLAARYRNEHCPEGALCVHEEKCV
jgi:hypothetical protein